jgi:hypothetical protein
MSTRYTAVVSLVLGAVLSAGAAWAGQLTVAWVQFPNGNPLVLTETVESPLKMTADEHLYQKGEGPNNNTLVTFEFLFWNKGGTIQTDRTIDDDPGNSDNFATAWYLETGGGGSCPPTCFVTTWAFSTKNNTLIANTTPIGSVEPSTTPALWTPPSTSVSTSTKASKDVTINALDHLGDPKFGSVFQSWLVLSGKPPFKPSTGQSFTVPAYTSADAIAFYSSLPGPCPQQPCICQQPPCRPQ